MKPTKTYFSKTNKKSSVSLILFLIFLTQFFYFSIDTIRIRFPNRFIEVPINAILPDEFRVKIDQPSITGLKNIRLGNIQGLFNGEKFFDIQDLSISLNPSLFLSESISIINSLDCSRMDILPENNQSNHFKLQDFSFKNIKSQNSSTLRSRLSFGGIQSYLAFDFEELNKIIQKRFTSKPTKKINFSDWINQFASFQKKFSDWSSKLSDIEFNIHGMLNHEFGSVFITQNETVKKDLSLLKGLRTSMAWHTDSKYPNLLNIDFQTHAEQLNLSLRKLSLNWVNPSFQSKGNFDINNIKFLSSNSWFSYKSLTSTGLIGGEFPTTTSYLKQKNSTLKADIFSDSNSSKVYLSIEQNLTDWSMDGLIHLNPQNFDLEAQLLSGNFEIIDGENLQLNFYTPRKLDQPRVIKFFLSGKELSVLEAPHGDFYFSGNINPDLSIDINQASGNLGKSHVEGSYHQKWNPADYRFLIEGTCHPPDINNWLGYWWSPLWENFSFNESVSHGNFSIHGTWGGKPGNSITIGQVYAQNLKYKDLCVLESNIDVEVNGLETRISSKKIKHDFGEFKARLHFPRKRAKDDTLLRFSLDGDIPFNDARRILGDKIENALNDLNASIIYCKGSGDLKRNDLLEKPDSNQTTYKLTVSTETPFSYAGVNFNYAKGEVYNHEGLMFANFSDLGLSGGHGRLSFKNTSKISDRINFSFDLKEANSRQLFNNLANTTQWNNSEDGERKEHIETRQLISKSKEGKINLSIQAEGPSSDPNYFEGTGNLTLYDFDIGSIHLLGGIRKKLGAFNLPLPSDALNFNHLEVPFILQHDRILFDKAILTGPLSKLVGEGEINWIKSQVDIFADLNVAGNINIPVLKQIVNLADPLSKISKMKIFGELEDPEWSIYLGDNLLNP